MNVVTSPAVNRLTELNDGADRLCAAVAFAKENTFFYKRLLRKHFRDGLTAHVVKQQFTGVPFTSKDDVVRNYPDGLLAVPYSDVALYCESSGTTGDTTRSTKSASFFTSHDLQRDCKRRFSPDLGLKAEDIVANALPFALTSSGVGFFTAARQSGAMTFNLDSGSLLSSPAKHLDLVADLKATVLICSLPLMYSTMLALEGKTVREVLPNLRAIQLCGVATLPHAKRKISELFGCPVFDTYGLSEFGATTFTCRDGHMHIHEDDFLIEIVDPWKGDPSADGIAGEITITTLERQGSPKIRYRTGDIGFVNYDQCTCGRSSPRLTVKGRQRDAAMFNGRFCLPTEFEETVLSFPQSTGMYRLTYNADAGATTDELKVSAELVIDCSVNESAAVRREYEATFKEQFGDSTKVRLCDPGEATPQLFDLRHYSSLKSAKSATFADERPAEWLITY